MVQKTTPNEPIAVVGSACRFAGGVDNPSKLWELLRDPKDVRKLIPGDRFSADAFYHPNNAHHGHSNVKHSYMLDQDPTVFDAEFFGINPIESRAMDPQQRLLMETVYEAVEAAGMNIQTLRGSDTSVYAGVMCGDYEALLLRDLDSAPTYFAVGTSRAILSNRISYFFDWHGPSITMDTACSSSLVAVHMAVQSLRNGESRMALACGSNLILGPESYIIESKLKMLSPTGQSRMWDKDANGYARGDGVAAVALKTLSQALADGDHIECIIRETGVNQDGASTGLTMPSSSAQRALIHETYRKAGLDLSKISDRPQYFEAHGTGTPAGDPVEAEAISSAFFDEKNSAGHCPLYVGSIKTVLGHTEGTAGIAALLKASLAMQNSTLPPNLLFDNINPSVEPFYHSLEIKRSADAWPSIPQDVVKRTSVNSFGFGGTNAHAIVESYVPSSKNQASADAPLFTPFVFSAASEKVLRANLSALSAYLESGADVNIQDLAYTLRDRRSLFAHRFVTHASSLSELHNQLSVVAEDANTPVGSRGSTRPASPRLLGVFTGQGAQYAQMGAELLTESPYASRIIEELEAHLAALPQEDRPTWSLRAEILADSSKSRIGEAALSQPLCTAIQIILVDVLRAAGITFAAVVGHSSGEIAAAYAAGYITAKSAIYIAYYRGLHCRLAASPNGDIKGAMLAVGTSMEDAEALCEEEELKGRITVAACNSSSSVTIAGDEDAIEELREVLTDEGKFHRRLRVDQAYHSRHMLPCFDPYVKSLVAAGVTAQKPSTETVWYSSVLGGQPAPLDTLSSNVYWAENMTKPVLFAQAVKAAVQQGAEYDLALEVGPHPALKGPAVQTIEESAKALPYYGTLSRDDQAVRTLSQCLGSVWTHIPVDLTGAQVALSGNAKPNFRVVKGLPLYQWNHSVRHWHESRRSRRMRLREQPFHPLLGDVSPDSAPHALRWKNILKPSEIPWLEGHQVQKQIVFPAAGYVCTAIEAAQSLPVKGRTINLIEIENFYIHQAVMFGSEDAAIEVLIELGQINQPQSDCIEARFTYSAAIGDSTADLSLAADGVLRVWLGDASEDLLPERAATPSHLIPVESERLYNFMESLEYDFSGPFRSLSTLRRKLGWACCQANKAVTDDADQVLVHPVDLDAALQSVMLAYSYPGDDQLRNLHLPTSISKIRVNPAVLRSSANQLSTLDIDSRCDRADRASPGSGFSGQVDIFVNGCNHAAIQMDQAKFKPLGASPNKDRNVFYKMHWVPSKPDGHTAAHGIPVTEDDTRLLWILSRIASYYLRTFTEDVPKDAPARTESPLCHYLNYAEHMTNLLKTGEHRYAKQEWQHDTEEDVLAEIKAAGVEGNSDVQIMLLVGRTMPRVFRGETTMLEHMRESGLLDLYYAQGFGTMQSSLWLGNTVRQLTEHHSHLSLLEIGAGTGGATKNILKTIGRNFDSYTFTDVSSSFFENAAEIFEPWRDRMVFKVCDAERDPMEQGFIEGTYDVIVASLVVHATAKLDQTMRNLRRLLKPGGFLVIGEGSSDGPLQSGDGFIFGALPGWWLGVEEGRTLSPFINVPQWDECLKRTGFSGLDTMAPPEFLETFGVVLFVSQAVDERVNFVREPLAIAPRKATLEKLMILGGGQDAAVANAVRELQVTLTPYARSISTFATLQDIDFSVVDEDTTVIALTELEAPVFEGITDKAWKPFQQLFQQIKTMLWVTAGRLEDRPFSNMVVGFARSASHERDEMRVQMLDIVDASQIDSKLIAENLLRFTSEDLSSPDILHTVETEICVDAAGRQLVPRLGPIAPANDRYNSIQRPIVHDVATTGSAVELRSDAGAYNLRQLSRYERALGAQTAELELTATHAVLRALRTPFGHLFLTLAVDGKGQRHLALDASLTSILRIPASRASSVTVGDIAPAAYLETAAAHLTAISLIGPMVSGQQLVVHNASPALRQAISAQAADRGVVPTFTTDSSSDSASAIRLHPFMGRSEVAQRLPSNVACFASFGDGTTPIEATIISSLSPYCRKELASTTLTSASGTASELPSDGSIPTLLRTLAGHVEQASGSSASEYVVAVADVVRGETPSDTLAVVEWSTSASLPVQISRFDVKPMFRSDKTYWLCGMSGALGISTCDWMISRGVKYLILTSRNPKVEAAWIEGHKRDGVTVEIMSCDVTNEAALRAVHQRIVAEFPPIVGVLNGAMVLRDVSVANMEIDQVHDVIRPKVLGSLHLDRIFYDTDLDFFLLMSSINCVIGNVGQANYAAANMGMIGVAGNRRKRGLHACAINIGAVIGAGYITQSDRQLDATVAKMHMMHLSEDDFHQCFAEGIESGQLDSPVGAELSTGLLDVSLDASEIPKWFSDPKFERFIVARSANDEDKRDQGNTVSIPEQLQACTTPKAVLEVVRTAFAAQLRKILQMNGADEELLAMRGIELGLDSLISVDIRSWFLKHFQASIPVLKIMGNDVQMSGLAEFAADNIPAELTPQLHDARDGDSSGDSLNPSTAVSSPSSPRSEDGACDDDINWDLETQPPADVVRATNVVPADKIPEVVVLTGVSGLLGHHLLDALLQRAEIKKVICIAVRNLAGRLAAKEIPPPSDRVAYYEGDLTLPRLGLSEEQAASVFNEADAIIHNGSDTSHLKYYSALRTANVGSTRQLLDFALPRMIPFHYVSSAGVALYADGDAFPEVSCTISGRQPARDGAHGYMCGKWVCESLLERVNAKYGLRVWVQRPSTIIREGDDAVTQKAGFDWVNALIHYAHVIRAVPRVEYTRGAFDLVAVQTCCTDIITGLLGNTPKLANGMTYVNNVGDIVIPMEHLDSLAESKGRELYETLPMARWAQKAIDAGLHPAVAALIETFDEQGSDPYPRLLHSRS